MRYSEKIDDLLRQIENLQDEIKSLEHQAKREVIDNFTFTDEQIKHGACYFIKTKLKDNYADESIIEDSIDIVWTADQIRNYEDLGADEDEGMNEVFDKYFDAVKQCIENFIETLEYKES